MAPPWLLVLSSICNGCIYQICISQKPSRAVDQAQTVASCIQQTWHKTPLKRVTVSGRFRCVCGVYRYKAEEQTTPRDVTRYWWHREPGLPRGIQSKVALVGNDLRSAHVAKTTARTWSIKMD
ncbi:hypothetical protein FALCPG4_014229 [Fusarium falciforme]